jgi:hypothetical protein
MRLWEAHTKTKEGSPGRSEGPAKAYKTWSKIIKKINGHRRKTQPFASLVEFYRYSATVADKD